MVEKSNSIFFKHSTKILNDAVNLHHAITFASCKRLACTAWGFSLTLVKQLGVIHQYIKIHVGFVIPQNDPLVHCN